MTEHDDEKVAPQVALGRFLTAIKNRADVDAQFRDSLVQALGFTVLYSGEDDITNVAPHIVAAQKRETQFRSIYGQLTAPKARAILKKWELATTTDLAKKSFDQLIDMLWTRASNRARERGLLD